MLKFGTSALARRCLDLLVTVPVKRRKGSFVLIQNESGDLRNCREPLRRSALQAQLTFHRALLDDLDGNVLHQVRRDRTIIVESRERARRDIHDRPIVATGGNVGVRHFPGQQLAIKKNVIFERQLVGERWPGGKFDLHFQPHLSLVRLKLFRARVSILRRRDQVLRDSRNLEFRCGTAPLPEGGKRQQRKHEEHKPKISFHDMSILQRIIRLSRGASRIPSFASRRQPKRTKIYSHSAILDRRIISETHALPAHMQPGLFQT